MSAKLHAAMLEIAKLKKGLDALRPPTVMFPPGWRESEKGRAYEREKYKIEALMERYASDAKLRQHMVPWMVDIEGRETTTIAVGADMSTEERELYRAINADFGVLPKRVRQWLTTHEFHVSESGGGSTGWHLGVACSDEMAERLCRLANQEFRSLIDNGMLSVRITFRRWCFAGLQTEEDVANFLNNKVSS